MGSGRYLLGLGRSTCVLVAADAFLALTGGPNLSGNDTMSCSCRRPSGFPLSWRKAVGGNFVLRKEYRMHLKEATLGLKESRLAWLRGRDLAVHPGGRHQPV